MRLRAHSAGALPKRPYIAPREDDIETIIQLDHESGIDDTLIVATSTSHASSTAATRADVKSVSATADSASAVSQSDSTKTRSQRRSIIFAVMAGAVTVVGATGAWLARDSHVPAAATALVANTKNSEIAPVTTAPVAAQKAATGDASNSVVALSPVAKPVTISDTASVKPAGVTRAQGVQQADGQLDKKEKGIEAKHVPVKRKIDNQTPRKSDATVPLRTEDANKSREAAARSTQNEVARLSKLKSQQQISQQTPQQACADRSNFISRGICESRECEKPERASLKFCVDMKARRAPREYAN